jgi:hypothetical protein
MRIPEAGRLCVETENATPGYCQMRPAKSSFVAAFLLPKSNYLHNKERFLSLSIRLFPS